MAGRALRLHFFIYNKLFELLLDTAIKEIFLKNKFIIIIIYLIFQNTLVFAQEDIFEGVWTIEEGVWEIEIFGEHRINEKYIIITKIDNYYLILKLNFSSYLNNPICERMIGEMDSGYIFFRNKDDNEYVISYQNNSGNIFVEWLDIGVGDEYQRVSMKVVQRILDMSSE